MLAREGGVLEPGLLAGDEPDGLVDLGRDRRAVADVPPEGDPVHPAPEEPLHAFVAGDHIGQGRLSEPSCAVQGGGDAHGAAPAAQGLDDPAGFRRPLHHPVGDVRQGWWRGVVGETHRGPAPLEDGRQERGRRAGNRENRRGRPRMTAHELESPGPVRLDRSGGVDGHGTRRREGRHEDPQHRGTPGIPSSAPHHSPPGPWFAKPSQRAVPMVDHGPHSQGPNRSGRSGTSLRSWGVVAAPAGVRQRPWRDLTLSPKVQPFEPSQLTDHVMSPFSEPPKAFHDWPTRLGVMWPPPAPGWAGRPGTCLS